MIIFGADPSLPSKDMPEIVTSGPRPRKVLNELINYFGYHKGMKMSQRFNETDRAVLGRQFSSLLKNGVTSESLKRMIDLFYSSPHSASGFPALTFTKREVQEELTEQIDVVSSDACANWLVDGMPDDGPFTNSAEMRKAVLLYADDASYRYPDVVASILQLDYTYEETCDLLQQLCDVLSWKLRETEDAPEASDLARLVRLPEELDPTKRLPEKSIRRKSTSVRHAFASIPKKRRKEW